MFKSLWAVKTLQPMPLYGLNKKSKNPRSGDFCFMFYKLDLTYHYNIIHLLLGILKSGPC